jgi:hypothetical protein
MKKFDIVIKITAKHKIPFYVLAKNILKRDIQTWKECTTQELITILDYKVLK